MFKRKEFSLSLENDHSQFKNQFYILADIKKISFGTKKLNQKSELVDDKLYLNV